MFLYKDDSHELDIEMSRWNDGYGANKTADCKSHAILCCCDLYQVELI